MAVRTQRSRKVLAFSLHGRTRDGVIDYVDFFDRLSTRPARNRQVTLGEDLVAVPTMQGIDSAWLMRFVVGAEGLPPLLFAPATGSEVEADIGNQILASASWVLLDPVTRLVAVEQKRPGVPVSTIARSLSRMAVDFNFSPHPVTFDLNPVPSPSFLEELENLERIREATVVVAEPNYSWRDSAAELTSYAADSGGASARVTVSAGRGKSLEKDLGIVADIKQLVPNKISSLKDIRVAGRRRGETKESTVTLGRHQERVEFEVPSGASSADHRDAFGTAATELLSGLDVQEAEDTN